VAQIDIEVLKRKVSRWASSIGYKTIIFLHGSHAKGTATEDSDVDFYVVFGEALSKQEFNLVTIDDSYRWEKELSALIGMPVHLSFYYRSSPKALLDEVIRANIKLYDYREEGPNSLGNGNALK
jgi:predicted nucleotidyltransferase